MFKNATHVKNPQHTIQKVNPSRDHGEKYFSENLEEYFDIYPHKVVFPNGNVVYSKSEISELFNKGLSNSSFKFVHEAKKEFEGKILVDI